MSALGLALVLLTGCDPNNEDPIILSVNDKGIRSLLGLRYVQEPLLTEVGERLDITLEIYDPDNDPTSVWWAQSPPGWSWDPSSHSGHWDVPEDYWAEWQELFPLVTDDRDPAGTDMVWLAIYVEGAAVPVEDTGAAEVLLPWRHGGSDSGGGDTGRTGDSGD